ncbi:Probable O-methyltransferase 3 [Linum grandiflorum]
MYEHPTPSNQRHIDDGTIEESKHNRKKAVTTTCNRKVGKVIISGKERDEEEWATLFVEVGFTSYHIRSIFGARALIEVYP